MNGRVYDPFLGRMISADPSVPGPFNGQAFNRYAYVFNNPLRLTDPSGFNPAASNLTRMYADGSGGVDLDPVAVVGEQEDGDKFATDNGGTSPVVSMSAFGISGMAALGWFSPTGITIPAQREPSNEDETTILDTVEVLGRKLPDANLSAGFSASFNIAGLADIFGFEGFSLSDVFLAGGISIGTDGIDVGLLVVTPGLDSDTNGIAGPKGLIASGSVGIFASNDSLGNWSTNQSGPSSMGVLSGYGLSGNYLQNSQGSFISSAGWSQGFGASFGTNYVVDGFTLQGAITTTLCGTLGGC